MKKILSIIALASSAIFSAHGALVYTTFDIPAGSANVGFFEIGDNSLDGPADLSTPGSLTRPYAYRFFNPSVTGLYTLGMTYADYDAAMLLYSGQTSFPELDPSAGIMDVNDDGNWDTAGATLFFGTQTVDPSAGGGIPSLMPLLKDQSLTAGTNYLVAISTYGSSPNPLPLPASFFVAGPGSVTLDGAPTAAVPEPGQVAASLLLLGGIGGYVFLKRRKAAQGVSAPVAA